MASPDIDNYSPMGINVLATQRSGHHAFIEWLLSGIDNRYIFLNNPPPFKNPYNLEYLSSRPFYRVITNFEDQYELGRLIHRRADGLDRVGRRVVQICNYENPVIGEWSSRMRHSSGLIEPDRNVIVIRDPLNNVASFVRMAAQVPREFRRAMLAEQFVSSLISILKEVLGYQNGVQNKMVVDFGEWLKNCETREALRAKLQLNSPAIPALATQWGGGSSFGSATPSSGVNSRYHGMLQDRGMQVCFGNEQLLKLSREYYLEKGASNEAMCAIDELRKARVRRRHAIVKQRLQSEVAQRVRVPWQLLKLSTRRLKWVSRTDARGEIERIVMCAQYRKPVR